MGVVNKVVFYVEFEWIGFEWGWLINGKSLIV